jgi:hypothetical protein
MLRGIARLYRRLIVRTNTRRAESLLESEGIAQAWPLIRRVFKASDKLYYCRLDGCGRPNHQSRLVSRIADHVDSDEFAWHDINDECPMVRAYCLLILHLRHSAFLSTLPSELLASNEPVHYLTGSFGYHETLGQLAASWSESHSRP